MNRKIIAGSAGYTDYIAINDKQLLVSPISGEEGRAIFKSKVPLNDVKYWPERNLTVITDMRGNISCFDVAAGAQLWTKQIKAPIGGMAIWENNSSIAVDTDGGLHLDIQTGNFIDITIGAGCISCFGGIVSHYGRETYYLSSPIIPVRLEGDPYCRFAVEAVSGLVYVANMDDKTGSIAVFDKHNGRIHAVIKLQNCSFIRQMMPNIVRNGVVIFGYSGEKEAAVWRIVGTEVEMLHLLPRRDFMTLNKHGAFAIYTDGSVLSADAVQYATETTGETP